MVTTRHAVNVKSSVFTEVDVHLSSLYTWRSQATNITDTALYRCRRQHCRFSAANYRRL